jgi:hypothetical protein
MKLISLKNIILFSFIFLSKVYASDIIPDTATINFIRSEFYASIEDEEKTYELEHFIINKYSDDYSKYNPIILAYYGGVQALKAKHAFNPVSKLSHLISGLNRLKEAIGKSPDNLEIRFMRFSILDNVPAILGYGDERMDDRNKICILLLKKDYSSLTFEIQKGIIEYMLASDRLSTSQSVKLQELISSLARK